MQIPKRKGEEDKRKLQGAPDRHLTKQAIERMKWTVKDLVLNQRPEAIKEVHRTQEMGDLSENAAYQEAKWRLRRINSRIDSLEDKIAHAIEIPEGASDKVRIGSTVVLQSKDKEIKYQIVGATEADPKKARISHQSPVGTSLLGHKISDHIMIADVDYQIIEIR